VEEPVQLAPGDVLARKYRLLEPLGEGGMAVVWVAINIALDMKVAVKILRAGLANDARLVARVRQEAKATASIAHKNIVQVYDYGVTAWGAPFIVMELLRGETLADRLKARGKLRTLEAARIALRAMKGITVAHAKGIIHRDLKPENIFLALEDNGMERPKVLDFGVSFVAREGGDDRSRSGGMVGTPAYLPPEAISLDHRGDARGDVWALGVMLYEMVTGELPFQGPNTHALLESILKDDPPPMHALAPGADVRLEAIVGRALAKDPTQRYPGVRELFDDLNVWLGEKDASVSVPRLPAGVPLALPSDPHSDDEGDTVVGPSLESSGQTPAAYDRDSDVRGAPSSPAPPTASSRPTLRAAPPTKSPFPVAAAVLVIAALGAVSIVVARTLPSQRVAPVVMPEPAAAPPINVLADGVDVSLDIVSLPEGATVTVDGQTIELPTRVRRGSTVHVRVEAPNYASWSQDVSAEGAVRLTYSGTPKPAASPARTFRTVPTRPPGDYKDVPY
jgi:eukaryotic-like serine/threonine-protein kinase